MGEGCTEGCQSGESQPHGVLCVEPTFWNQGRQEHHQIRVEGLKFVKNALTGEADYTLNGLKELQRHTKEGWLKNRDGSPDKPMLLVVLGVQFAS